MYKRQLYVAHTKAAIDSLGADESFEAEETEDTAEEVETTEE